MRVLVLLLLLLSVAHAEEHPAEAARAKLQELLEANKISEALRHLETAVSEHPGDGDLHYRYALLLSAVNDKQGALSELEAADRLIPDEPAIVGDLAAVQLDLGDEKRARETAERLAKLAPDDPRAKAVLDDLAARERIRAHRQPDVPTGTPAAVLHQALLLITEGKLAQVVEGHLTPSLRELLGADQNAHETLKDTASKAIGAFEGFEVDPNARITGDTAEVDLHVLFTRRMTREAMEKQLTTMESPLAAQALPSETRELLAGLEPADRRAMFERLIERPQVILASAVVTLVREGGAWQVSDLVLEGGVRLSEIFRQVKKMVDAEPVLDTKSRAARLGEGLGRLLGVLAVAGALLYFYRRRRRQ